MGYCFIALLLQSVISGSHDSINSWTALVSDQYSAHLCLTSIITSSMILESSCFNFWTFCQPKPIQLLPSINPIQMAISPAKQSSKRPSMTLISAHIGVFSANLMIHGFLPISMACRLYIPLVINAITILNPIFKSSMPLCFLFPLLDNLRSNMSLPPLLFGNPLSLFAFTYIYLLINLYFPKSSFLKVLKF